MTEFFDGRAAAAQLKQSLVARIAQLGANHRPQIVSFYFREDAGSRLYTRMKAQAAAAVGIKFEAHELSFGEPPAGVVAQIETAAAAQPRAGLMVQKPTQRSFGHFWAEAGQPVSDYQAWWQQLVAAVPPTRDLDGQSPATLARLQAGQPVSVLPATVQAVLASLAGRSLDDKNILIIGQSDLLGTPLYYYWRTAGYRVDLVGQAELAPMLVAPARLTAYQVIVSATGCPDLITGEMIAPGSWLVDVGEPRPDFEQASCQTRAAFMTPVPGGIGPMTIACLLANSVTLSELNG